MSASKDRWWSVLMHCGELWNVESFETEKKAERDAAGYDFTDTTEAKMVGPAPNLLSAIAMDPEAFGLAPLEEGLRKEMAVSQEPWHCDDCGKQHAAAVRNCPGDAS